MLLATQGTLITSLLLPAITELFWQSYAQAVQQPGAVALLRRKIRVAA
jgi:hypothetical protein